MRLSVGAALVIALLLGAAGAWTWHVQAVAAAEARGRAQVEDMYRLRQKAADADVERREAQLRAELSARVKKAEDLYAVEKKRRLADARSARAELDGLLRDLAEPRPAAGAPGPGSDPAAGPGADEASVDREHLGQCARALTAVAGQADALTAQVLGLQAYILTLPISQPSN